MEKLMYAVWRRDATPVREFRRTILETTAPALLSLGVRGLAINLADDLAVPGLRIARLDPAGTVAVWVDTALERRRIESLLHAVTPRLAGWLVLESVPLVNTRHVVPLGERIPGLYTVAFLEKPEALGYDDWLARWQGGHTRVAIETQSTFAYIQNVLVRAVTADAPPWTAIVEEAFPAEAATDPMVFYRARTREELAENQRRLVESCASFIDFDRLETHPMSAYVLRRLC
jgi:hypothetical protein